MSIIYDALKKAEKNIDANRDKETPADKKGGHFKFNLHLLYILGGCLGIFIGNLIFGFLSYPKTNSENITKQIPVAKKADLGAYPKEQPIQVPAVKAPSDAIMGLALEAPANVSRYNKESQEPFVLNGIFFSDNKGFALINNQIVAVGDKVSGATVKRISADEVELDLDGSTLKLTTRQR